WKGWMEGNAGKGGWEEPREGVEGTERTRSGRRGPHAPQRLVIQNPHFSTTDRKHYSGAKVFEPCHRGGQDSRSPRLD
ncbi:hypothetical protein TNCV_1598651, partial [Trichonephila clavipes]